MIGTTLGSYEILEEIGRGGTATVYKATNTRLERTVAVKVLHESFQGDAKLMARFEREARLIARLEHPHILPVHDFDGTNQPPYIVMRYLPTGTLKNVLETGELLPLEEVYHVIQQVGSALDHAHRQGIIHRDVKPSNVMIDLDGNAFLTDFGVARPEQGDTQMLTATGVTLGTPGYMSPEQANAEPLDSRTDIYSLGVILFELLAGRSPYIAPTRLMLIMRHNTDPIPSISQYRLDLPKGINDIISKAMAKTPSQRYETGEELAEDLRRVGNIALLTNPETLSGVMQRLVLETPPKQEQESDGTSSEISDISFDTITTAEPEFEASVFETPVNEVEEVPTGQESLARAIPPTDNRIPATPNWTEAPTIVDEPAQQRALKTAFNEMPTQMAIPVETTNRSWMPWAIAGGALMIAVAIVVAALLVLGGGDDGDESRDNHSNSATIDAAVALTLEAMQPTEARQISAAEIDTVWASEATDAAVNAIDGDRETRWDAESPAEQWIEIQFTQPRTVTTIRLLPGQIDAATHRVEGLLAEDDPLLLGESTTDDTATALDWLTIEASTPWENLIGVRITTSESEADVAWREIEIFGMAP